ncbi:Peptidase S26A, signal peptidase I (chromatophore) [Paulinella micropora]|uniref:Mitochondrial inner membrane protease subunit n=1 Tax=Paulinella micropora TaxID=1928728 RepID=A0A1L5YCL0_9EUKA|nr:peptidase S26A [Paulinella micropora]AQX45208.1 Peptidase S26A, signal peptidase I [Paulinella micropora]BBL86427.1 Peptidase S26A, signal peptidase I [Paulinella micropora]
MIFSDFRITKGSALRSLLIWLILGCLIRWIIIEPRWIPSGSMLPTLQVKDRILVERLRVDLHQAIPIDSIVVFRPPINLRNVGYDPKAALVKRVVGRPGDKIEVKFGQLWRNDVEVATDWSFEQANYSMPLITVPKNTLLVMGDNRNFSLDSHLWGPLPIENLIGTVVWRYWPIKKLGII